MPIDSQPLALLICLLAVCLGALVQGSVGFGLGLVAAPVLVLQIPEFVPGPLLAAALVLTILMARRESTEIDLAGLVWLIAGRFTGSIFGAFLLLHLTPTTFKIIFGTTILLAVGLSLAGISIQPDRRNQSLIGILSGVMAITTSVGGPPIALLYQKQSGPKLRGTLSGFFLIGIIFSLFGLATVGKFGIQELRLTVPLTIAVLVGYGLSSVMIERLDGAKTRPIVLLLATASCLVILIRAWSGR